MDDEQRPTLQLTRREFGKLAGVSGIGLSLSGGVTSALAAGGEKVNPAKIIKGKSPDMIVHNAKLGVMETPLTLLREHNITPKNIMYNRTHFPVSGSRAWTATTEPPNFDHWTIDVSGLVERTRQVSLDDLKKMEQTQITAVMQCAGNGRHFYAKKAKAPGGQWRHGGLANVRWEGVPLRKFLDKVDVGMSDDVRFLTANGADNPPVHNGQDLIKSYHIDDPALDNALLAVKMNGEPIPAIHGGPVRLIIPGFYGNMNVKFVNQLLFESEQSPSHFQSQAYRVPYAHVEPGQFTIADFNVKNSRPTYNFKIMSLIFAPLETDKVSSGKVKVRGVAWNDGSAKITNVSVSANGGRSWQAADIDKPESRFAWYPWETHMDLDQGEHELMVIAQDAEGNTQPLNGNVRWNPKGYEWNGVDRVKVKVS